MRPRKVDVRVLSATNRDLEAAMVDGGFREDLYYRLNVFPIFMPPLRERPDDIALLVDHFIEKYARELGRDVTGCSEEAMQKLLRYRFPGNVRELENVIERAMILCEGERVTLRELPSNVLSPPEPGGAEAAAPARVPMTLTSRAATRTGPAGALTVVRSIRASTSPALTWAPLSTERIASTDMK